MYEYTLVFQDTKAHANADALSRLPLNVVPEKTETPPELFLLAEHLRDSQVTADDIRVWTSKDKKLSHVLQFTSQGWPSHYELELNLFSAKKEEISVYNGCVLWGLRVVIPKPGRTTVLQELHEGHP